jgi:hypothetical protein
MKWGEGDYDTNNLGVGTSVWLEDIPELEIGPTQYLFET